MKLSVRLTAVLTGLGMAVIPATCGLAWILAAQQIRDTIDRDLTDRVQLLDQASRRDLEAAARLRAEDISPSVNALLGSQESGVQLFDGNGQPVGESRVPISAAAEAAVAEAGLAGGAVGPSLETVIHNDARYRVLTVVTDADRLPAPLADGPVLVQFYRDVSAEQDDIASLAVQMALLATLGVIGVAVTGWFVGRWVAEPIDQLTDVAERLADLDDPPARIEMSRNDEVGRLADSFNRMLSALEVGREQQRRLVADASHELRTPLTSLRMRAEFLAARPTVDQTQHDLLTGAVAEVEQLSALVDDLVDLAADVRSVEEVPRPMALAAVANEVADRTRTATRRSIDVSIEPGAVDRRPSIRPIMVRRALQNLVDNAVKYAPTGSITITVGADRLSVSDCGPGIGPDDVDHVFDRFYRSPKARTRPGNGIGLAIVDQVAKAHDGTTWIGPGIGGEGVTVGFSVSPLTLPPELLHTTLQNVFPIPPRTAVLGPSE
jgi:two-component system sensor histidine kinase MprB